MKAFLSMVPMGLLLGGCLQFAISGNSFDTNGRAGLSTGGASSTGSTTAAASTGGRSSGSPGGTSSSSTSSSSTGTTGGSPPDAGACVAIATSLQNIRGYSGSPANLSSSADFNGDGLLDLVLAPNDGTFSVLFGLADGGLAPAGSPFFVGAAPVWESIGVSIVAADVNGDGLPDVLFVGDSGIDFVPNVAGELTMGQPLIAAPFVGALAVADLNLDGIPDIVEVETAGDSTVNTFLGLGGGEFSKPIRVATLPVTGEYVSPARLFVADGIQDGFPDIGAVAYNGTQLEILVHKSDGGYLNSYYTFASPLAVAPMPRVGAPPDIVVGYDVPGGGAGLLQVLINTGDGTFTMGPIYDVPNTIDQIAVSTISMATVLRTSPPAGASITLPAGTASPGSSENPTADSAPLSLFRWMDSDPW